MTNTSVVVIYGDNSSLHYSPPAGGEGDIIENEIDNNRREVAKMFIFDSTHALYFLQKM